MTIISKQPNSIEEWCKQQLDKNKERIRSIMRAAGILEEEPVRTPHPNIKKPRKKKAEKNDA